MSYRFKITDIDNEQFYQLPKSLCSQKNYKGLGSDAKILYAILKDRMWLSRKNEWKDQNGDIFLLFAQDDLALMMDVSISTVSRAMKKLCEYHLIDIIRQGCNLPNKIYINHVEVAKSAADITPDPTERNIKEPSLSPTSFVEEDENVLKARICSHANPDLQVRESGFAAMQNRICTSEIPDLQLCKSGFAPVQANKTEISETEINETERDKNKQQQSPLYPQGGEVLDLQKVEQVKTFFKENVFDLSSPYKEKLLVNLIKIYSANWVVEAAKAAIEQNITTFSYIRTILENWQQNGFKYDERVKDLKNKKSKSSKGGSPQLPRALQQIANALGTGNFDE